MCYNWRPGVARPGRNFYYTTVSAICQAKSCTNFKEFFIPELCNLHNGRRAEPHLLPLYHTIPNFICQYSICTIFYFIFCAGCLLQFSVGCGILSLFPRKRSTDLPRNAKKKRLKKSKKVLDKFKILCYNKFTKGEGKPHKPERK